MMVIDVVLLPNESSSLQKWYCEWKAKLQIESMNIMDLYKSPSKLIMKMKNVI